MVSLPTRTIDSLLADKTSGLSPLMQSFFAGVQGVANTGIK